MTVIGAHPARLDLYMHPGDPVDFTVPVLNDDGDAADLSGWTAAARATAPDGNVLHVFTATVGVGQVEVSAEVEETAAWQWSVYAAHLVVTATAPGSAPIPLTTGWLRLYRP